MICIHCGSEYSIPQNPYNTVEISHTGVCAKCVYSRALRKDGSKETAIYLEKEKLLEWLTSIADAYKERLFETLSSKDKNILEERLKEIYLISDLVLSGTFDVIPPFTQQDNDFSIPLFDFYKMKRASLT